MIRTLYTPIQKFFNSDHCIFCLILANTIVLFLGFYCKNSSLLHDPLQNLVQSIDNAFIMLFLLEIFIKIHTDTWTGYWSKNWNKFDFIVTLVSSFALIQYFLPPSLLNNYEFLNLNGFTVCRFLRVFRVTLLIHCLPKVEGLIEDCNRALRPIVIIIVVSLVILFIVSIITCKLFQETSPEYFKDPLTACYTIFRLFTIDGWHNIPNEVACKLDFWGKTFVKLFFSIVLFCGGIIGMSYINSLIIDAMSENNNEKVLKRISELEDKIDKLLAEKEKNE